MRIRHGIQFSSYLSPHLLDYLRDRAKSNASSISSELRVILEKEMRADAVRSEVERALG